MQVKRNILIICEGEKSEPLFFNSIRDNFYNGLYDVDYNVISIRPDPISEDNLEERITAHTGRKSKRKKRPLKGSCVEERRIPLPLKWVVEAHKELEDGTYDEVWVVYDHDDHPALKEAWEEAQIGIDGKYVNIAFSSRCFEFYLLSHFEKYYHSFRTSECKGADDKPLLCGSINSSANCNGEKCVNGYMRLKGYLPPTGKTKGDESTFKLVGDKLEIGFENAAWIRFKSDQCHGEIPVYKRNPYITTDALVKRLIGHLNEYFWMTYGEMELEKNQFLIIDSSSFFVENRSDITHLYKFTIDGNDVREIVEPHNRKLIEYCNSEKLIKLKYEQKIIFIVL